MSNTPNSPRTSAEPFASRWGRRSRTIPLMLGATTVGLLASPLILVAATVSDVARGRFRLPTVRVALFALQYGINDCVEILVAPVYWVAAGFGTRFDRPASIARHQRLQRWSIEVLARRAERLLGLRFEAGQEVADALLPADAIVLCRHVSIIDASLPAWLYLRLGHASRGVIMGELLIDPGFDLIYARTGSVFIARDQTEEALTSIRALAASSPPDEPIVIFPEGRLFRPDRLERARDRLGSGNPERAERLATLRHVLPPRPAGALALLEMTTRDVVVVAHAGLDRFSSFAALARSVPLRESIHVTAWRVPRTSIPDGTDDRIAWLDEQWCRVDHWIATTCRPWEDESTG